MAHPVFFLTIKARLPVRDYRARFVLAFSAKEKDEINQCADAEKTARNQPKDARADLADVESVNAECSEKEAKKHCNESALGRHKKVLLKIKILRAMLLFLL